MLKEDLEDSTEEYGGELDMDETIGCLLHYALALEILSQVYLQSASDLAEEDKSHMILNSLRQDKEFINSYKKTMANESTRGLNLPPKKFRFYMKGADA